MVMTALSTGVAAADVATAWPAQSAERVDAAARDPASDPAALRYGRRRDCLVCHVYCIDGCNDRTWFLVHGTQRRPCAIDSSWLRGCGERLLERRRRRSTRQGNATVYCSDWSVLLTESQPPKSAAGIVAGGPATRLPDP